MLRSAAAFVLCAFANAAGAQVSGTVSAVSDYRYRGITLSDQKPAVQAGIAYDAAPGWYAGVFGSTVRLAPPAGHNVEVIGFAGYALRLAPGVSLEAGGDYSAFTGASSDNYGEFFVGAATDNLSARVYYSPKYFGLQSNATYTEINASLPVIDHVRFHAHIGLLRASYPVIYGQPSEQHVVDGRIGLGIDVDLFHLELAWVGTNAAYSAYQITGSKSPNTVVLSLTRSF